MSEENRFCIYCGKELAEGEVCSCTTATVPTKFCIWCGKVLTGDEECTCPDALAGKVAVYDEPAPEEVEEAPAYAIDAECAPDLDAPTTAFCVHCGKTLYNGEACDCPDSRPAVPTGTCSICGRELFNGEVCDCESFVEVMPGSAPTPTGYCTECGKPLYNGEACTCTPAVKVPTGFCTSCGRQLFNGERCSCPDAVYIDGASGFKSTMRTEPKTVSHDFGAGKTYWSRPDDLD